MTKFKFILIMGIFTFLGCKPSESLSLSEKLDKIGYYDLIEDTLKKRLVKEKIDFEYLNDENPYIGKGWFIIPNDGYISSVNKLEEYKNKSSTSDFVAFEIWGEGLLSGEFESTLESIKVVFEKNGLELYWSDEKFEQEDNSINHTIKLNNKLYTIFSGTLTRDNSGDITYQYITVLRQILNDAINN